MKYALLVYEAPGSHEALPKEEFDAVLAEYMALADDPRFLNGAELRSVEMATTVRVDSATGAPLITDGPFADTKEVFGGYYVFEVDNLDQAIELAARIPTARIGGSVEIRPVMER